MNKIGRIHGSPQFVVTSAPTQHDDETAVTRGTWDVSFFADVTDSRGGDTLDLSRRHIGHLELPRGLRGMFPRLHTLDISHNKLVRLPIEIATQLPALRVFDCSKNVLESLEPGTRIASLPLPAALVRVDASYNRVEAFGDAFARCRGLESLRVAHNLLQSCEGLEHLPRLEHLDLRDNHIGGELGLRLLCFNRGLRSLWVEGNPIDRPRALVVGVAPQVLYLDGEHLAPGALGVKERKVFESPPEPRARMAVVRDSLSPLSRGMSEPERGV